MLPSTITSLTAKGRSATADSYFEFAEKSGHRYRHPVAVNSTLSGRTRTNVAGHPALPHANQVGTR